MSALPRLQMNAFAGAPSSAEEVSRAARKWALAPLLRPHGDHAPAALARATDWRDERVGWGLIVSESLEQLPPALERLLAARPKAPVLRYVSGSAHSFSLLRQSDGVELDIHSAPEGLGPRRLPGYLMIFGSPAQVPWRLQYILNLRRRVGRLDLDGSALDNYVDALLADFGAEAGADPYSTLVWATDHGPDDITCLMREQISARLYGKFQSDSELVAKSTFHERERATAEALVRSISDQKPGLIVTTSHGQTGPAHDQQAMLEQLGLPVDTRGDALNLADLLTAWEPNGAVWYAHACCSAGSDSASVFDGLFEQGSANDSLLRSLSALPANVSPLPKRLLGHRKPLRAFVGHVEPTFNWTLRQPVNGQITTDGIIEALYDRLYSGEPIGHTFAGWFAKVGSLYAAHSAAVSQYDQGADNLANILFLALAARDVQSTVILGDPTAILPLALGAAS